MFHACVRRFDVVDAMDTVGNFFGTKHDVIILVFVPPPMALGKLQRCAHLARSKASERENRSRHTCGGRSSSRRQIPDTLRHPRGRDHGAPRAGGECRAPGGQRASARPALAPVGASRHGQPCAGRAGCWLLLRARLLRPLPRHARRDRGPTPRRRATNRAATPG